MPKGLTIRHHGYLLLIILITAGTHTTAQQLRTSGIDNTGPTPLVIRNGSSNNMPLRIISGTTNLRALEIGSAGHTWMLGPLSIGSGVGAASMELMRIGAIAPQGGRGLTISLDATTTSSGLYIRDIGSTGSTDAAILLSSQTNGLGTGLRIGGPTGSGRPTLGTGIDITGGTGVRYNALTSGSGVAIDVGGTLPPRRGIEIVAAGPQHAGVIARANTNGMGVLGVSQSSSYESLPLTERVGVRGHAASNSGLSSDTIIGVLGSVQRGGSGGSMTASFGVTGRSESAATNNAGTAVGVYGSATSSSSGVSVAIGGAFHADTGQISLLATTGDVILGGEKSKLPVAFQTSTFRDAVTRNRTFVHHVFASGLTRVSSLAIPASPIITVPPTGDVLIVVPNAMVIRLEGDVAGSTVIGLRSDAAGRVLTILVTGGMIDLMDEHLAAEPEDRMHFKNDANLHLEQDDMIQLWYDQEIKRWRCYSF